MNVANVPPLIFTPEVCGKAQGPLDGLSPLVLRWAGGKDEHVERIREQIESAAALVPELQRARVLGPISPRASDDQVQAAVGGILLAKMLVDHGWTVEFEPAIGAQTPDLLIRKGSVENIVEIRRVVGRAAEDSRSRLMVQRVLEDIRTATPLNIARRFSLHRECSSPTRCPLPAIPTNRPYRRSSDGRYGLFMAATKIA